MQAKSKFGKSSRSLKASSTRHICRHESRSGMIRVHLDTGCLSQRARPSREAINLPIESHVVIMNWWLWFLQQLQQDVTHPVGWQCLHNLTHTYTYKYIHMKCDETHPDLENTGVLVLPVPAGAAGGGRFTLLVSWWHVWSQSLWFSWTGREVMWPNHE